MLEGFQTYPAEIVVALAAVIGLLVGSFLNVVIYRLPLQMQNAWRSDALDFLGHSPEPAETVNLWTPASRCPSCKSPIKPWQNIPVFSYLLLRGRCPHCGEPISIQYPIVELLSGVICAGVIYYFGLNAAALLIIVFSWILIALTGIDLEHQLLPDSLTIPLMWLGLLVNISGVFTDLTSAVIGAAAGYLALWSIYWLFKLVTGKEGMGHGDFKLLAALGAWVGWQQLPLIIVMSSLVGAILGTVILLAQRKGRGNPIAFGPYLAIAGWIALLAGDRISAAYLNTF